MRLLLNEWRKFLDEDSEDEWAFNPDGHKPLTRPEMRKPSSYSNMGDSEPLSVQALSYATEVLDEGDPSIDFTSLVTKVAEKMLMGPGGVGPDRTVDIEAALSSDAAISALREKGWIGKVLNDKVVTYNGDAGEFIEQAVAKGWKFIEDDYVDAWDKMIDWDKAMKAATAFLKDHGYEIEYN